MPLRCASTPACHPHSSRSWTAFSLDSSSTREEQGGPAGVRGSDHFLITEGRVGRSEAPPGKAKGYARSLSRISTLVRDQPAAPATPAGALAWPRARGEGGEGGAAAAMQGDEVMSCHRAHHAPCWGLTAPCIGRAAEREQPVSNTFTALWSCHARVVAYSQHLGCALPLRPGQAGQLTPMLAGEAAAQALGFIDMGTMLCKAGPEEAASSYSLTQLLVPGLEQRAWHLPALTGVPVSPGRVSSPAYPLAPVPAPSCVQGALFIVTRKRVCTW